MRLYTFEKEGQARLGAECNEQMVDLAAAYEVWQWARGPAAGNRPGTLPGTMLGLLRAGEPGLAAAREVIDYASRRPATPVGTRICYGFDEIRLLAPLPRPGKILCSGINYRGHLIENPGAQLPEEPFFFAKLPSAVIGPGEPIVRPAQTGQLDFEVELAAVIGCTLKEARESEVMTGVAGYTILHDVSARDVQFRNHQITLGKNFDSFCPLGPCLVTRDEIPDPGQLRLRSLVNGQVMQDASTADWLFSLPRLIGFLSRVMTLEPGDIVSTGTPSGVGVFRQPPVFLQPGDVVRLEIEGIGVLENPVKGFP